MEYLLNEEEYKRYVNSTKTAHELDNLKEALSEARSHMLRMSNYTCVHDRDGRYVGYCDGCPCSPIDHEKYSLWKSICGKPLAYGK